MLRFFVNAVTHKFARYVIVGLFAALAVVSVAFMLKLEVRDWRIDF